MIAPEAGLSVSRQCTLLGIARSRFYYRPRPEAAEELDLQLPDLAVQIVDHLLPLLERRRRAAARKQLARTLHHLLLPVADHRRMNPKLR